MSGPLPAGMTTTTSGYTTTSALTGAIFATSLPPKLATSISGGGVTVVPSHQQPHQQIQQQLQQQQLQPQHQQFQQQLQPHQQQLQLQQQLVQPQQQQLIQPQMQQQHHVSYFYFVKVQKRSEHLKTGIIPKLDFKSCFSIGIVNSILDTLCPVFG